jgi:hypothetical protein
LNISIVEIWPSLVGNVLIAIEDNILKIDAALLEDKHRTLFKHSADHESWEDELRLGEDCLGIRQITAISCSVRHFMNLSPLEQGEILDSLVELGENDFAIGLYQQARIWQEYQVSNTEIIRYIIEEVYFSRKKERAEQFARERSSIVAEIIDLDLPQAGNDEIKVVLAERVKGVVERLNSDESNLAVLERLWGLYDSFRLFALFGQLGAVPYADENHEEFVWNWDDKYFDKKLSLARKCYGINDTALTENCIQTFRGLFRRLITLRKKFIINWFASHYSRDEIEDLRRKIDSTEKEKDGDFKEAIEGFPISAFSGVALGMGIDVFGKRPDYLTVICRVFHTEIIPFMGNVVVDKPRYQ